MADDQLFKTLAAKMPVRLTPMGAERPITAKGEVVRTNGECIHVRLSRMSSKQIPKIMNYHEFMIRWDDNDPKNGVVVLAGKAPGTENLIFELGPDNRRQYQRVQGSFKVMFRRLDNEEQVHEAIDQIKHSIDGNGQLSGEDLGRNGDSLGKQMASMAQRLDTSLNEISDKLDYVIARIDKREAELPHRAWGTMHDISGSGFSYVCDDPRLQQGDFIYASFEISLTPFQKIQCVGEVMRLTENKDKSRSGSRCAGIQFHFITEEDRDKIIKYCFSVQRRLLRLHREIH